jgi:hypothetical protein
MTFAPMVMVFVLTQLPAEPPKAMELLRSVHRQWQADIGYKGTFVVRRAGFPNRAAADTANWNWERLPLDRTMRSEGHLAKLFSNVRVFCEPNRDPIVVKANPGLLPPGAPGGGSGVQFIGYEEITNERFALNRPAPKTRRVLSDDLQVGAREPLGQLLPPFSTRSSLDVLTPVRPLGIYQTDPFELRGGSEPGELPIESAIKMTESEGVEITLVAKRPDYQQTRILYFGPPPEWRFVRATEEFAARKPENCVTYSTELSDFIAVTNGMAARRIRNSQFESTGPVFQSEFFSADLGAVAPTLRDFQYEIPKGLRLSGLNDPEKFRQAGVIDLSQLKLTDLADISPPVLAESAEIEGTRDGWIWAGIGLVAAAIGLALLWRRPAREKI